jgi:hypothetical protein
VRRSSGITLLSDAGALVLASNEPTDVITATGVPRIAFRLDLVGLVSETDRSGGREIQLSPINPHSAHLSENRFRSFDAPGDYL